MYCVVITYSFYPEAAIYQYQTIAEAKQALLGFYEAELKEESGAFPGAVTGHIENDCSYATVTTHFENEDDDVTTFTIGTVYE